MFFNSNAAIHNRLLLGLPPKQLDQLLSEVTEVPLELKQVLHRPGDRFDYACFPQSGQVSTIVDLEDGSSVEVGMTGSEGVLIITLLLGGEGGHPGSGGPGPRVPCGCQLPRCLRRSKTR